ncbi:MAG: hypothetical protein Q7J76_12565 [Candidatus Brocadiaceae bacterium]|uniref:hypothetical protein n=1 Tax=Candidatus Wunengus sp. YC61 TaxID=3367698 RepID=UPI00271E028F|nr:hypothetical protein [Candidatus Brocadiaceae bacterium]
MNLLLWRDLFFTKSDHIVLRIRSTDKEYLELLHDDAHGKRNLEFSGDIYPYNGIGNLQNGVLLNFLKNKYILITFDLVAEGEIQQTLKGLGFVKGTSYLPIGLDEADRRNTLE